MKTLTKNMGVCASLVSLLFICKLCAANPNNQNTFSQRVDSTATLNTSTLKLQAQTNLAARGFNGGGFHAGFGSGIHGAHPLLNNLGFQGTRTFLFRNQNLFGRSFVPNIFNNSPLGFQGRRAFLFRDQNLFGRGFFNRGLGFGFPGFFTSGYGGGGYGGGYADYNQYDADYDVGNDIYFRNLHYNTYYKAYDNMVNSGHSAPAAPSYVDTSYNGSGYGGVSSYQHCSSYVTYSGRVCGSGSLCYWKDGKKYCQTSYSCHPHSALHTRCY